MPRRVDHALDVLGQALDIGVPPPHLLAGHDVGAAAALFARGLAALLEPDGAVELVHAADEAALLNHAGRRLLGPGGVEAEQRAEGVEADVVVEARDAEQVVLDDGLCQDGGAVGRGGELVRLQALGELVDLGGRQQAVEEHLLEDAELGELGGALVLVEAAQDAAAHGSRGRQDGALDGHAQRVQALVLGDGREEADFVVALGGEEEVALGVLDAGLRQAEVQVEVRVRDGVHDVLELVDVDVGGRVVADLEVIAHDAHPHARLVLVRDFPLGAVERDLGEGLCGVEEVVVVLVRRGQQLVDGGRRVKVRRRLGGQLAQRAVADVDPQLLVVDALEGVDEGGEEGPRGDEAGALAEEGVQDGVEVGGGGSGGRGERGHVGEDGLVAGGHGGLFVARGGFCAGNGRGDFWIGFHGG
ncbi:hypothetical protein MKX07_002722 [Trichoderma sp. CBMAI-0711]|nr:hypothetical protein MKX07_002722 [Trichoderma sp. CBMAI-0711]